jgi:hypothetical protein
MLTRFSAQLVCFYYVITTFTTVGYGAFCRYPRTQWQGAKVGVFKNVTDSELLQAIFMR